MDDDYIWPIYTALGRWERGQKSYLKQQRIDLDKATAYTKCLPEKEPVFLFPQKTAPLFPEQKVKFEFTVTRPTAKQPKKRSLWTRIKERLT